MGYVTVEGRNINYVYSQEAEAGVKKGYTVLLVHGAYDSLNVWSAQYQFLERDHTPIALDLPGHGESQGPPINNPDVFRQFIKAFVDVMGLAPFVFCGHSMGGSMALDYALNYPETLKGLILVGSSPSWPRDPGFIEGWRADPQKAKDASGSNLFSKKTPQHIIDRYDQQARANPAEVWLADAENFTSYKLNDEIHRIDLPALAICGDEEAWIEGTEEINAKLPNSTMKIVPAAGHSIMVEQPDQLNEAIGEFLKTIS